MYGGAKCFPYWLEESGAKQGVLNIFTLRLEKHVGDSCQEMSQDSLQLLLKLVGTPIPNMHSQRTGGQSPKQNCLSVHSST